MPCAPVSAKRTRTLCVKAGTSIEPDIYPAPRMAVVGTAAELASLLGGRGPPVVRRGAGMSTESGIPDFRSATGVWAEVDPFEVASIDAFRRDPRRVWHRYGPASGLLLLAGHT